MTVRWNQLASKISLTLQVNYKMVNLDFKVAWFFLS